MELTSNQIDINLLLDNYIGSDRDVVSRLYNGSKTVDEFFFRERIYNEFQPIICDLSATMQERVVLKHIELMD